MRNNFKPRIFVDSDASKLKTIYGNAQANDQLKTFWDWVNQLRITEPNSRRSKSFLELYMCVEDHIFLHKENNFDQTPYPEILKHFSDLAEKICSGKVFSEQEIIESSDALKKALLYKPPISKYLKMAIYTVIGALLGATIGFPIGLVIGFFTYGLAIPFSIYVSVGSAIAGGWSGFSQAQKSYQSKGKAYNRIWEGRLKDSRLMEGIHQVYTTIRLGPLGL